MLIEVSIDIDAPPDQVWQFITDPEGAVEHITNIESLEILERPPAGSGSIVGLKWKETRTMFGKAATETMWITDAVENEYYDVEARSHGCVYRSRMALEDAGSASGAGKTRLTMTFTGKAQTFGAKLAMTLFGWMMTGSTRKMIAADLDDIKRATEQS